MTLARRPLSNRRVFCHYTTPSKFCQDFFKNFFNLTNSRNAINFLKKILKKCGKRVDKTGMYRYNKGEDKEEVNTMTKVEITKELKKVNDAIMYEECADLHYNFRKVAELKNRKRELEKMLEEN